MLPAFLYTKKCAFIYYFSRLYGFSWQESRVKMYFVNGHNVFITCLKRIRIPLLKVRNYLDSSCAAWSGGEQGDRKKPAFDTPVS